MPQEPEIDFAMLSLSLSSMGFAGQSAGAMLRSNAPTMVKSASLPFLEAPPQLDGSMAGDVVSISPANMCTFSEALSSSSSCLPRK